MTLVGEELGTPPSLDIVRGTETIILVFGISLRESTESSILTGFKNATLTSSYILQKTVECTLSLLRCCYHEVASSVNTNVLIVQLNSTTLLLRKVLVNETFLK